MRNTEERVSAVKYRAKEIERRKQIYKGRIVMVSYATACVLLIVGLSLVMPGIMLSVHESEYAYLDAAAGIFDKGSGFDYVLIGFLAFLLGVSVTILSYHIHLRNQKNQEDVEDSDGRTS